MARNSRPRAVVCICMLLFTACEPELQPTGGASAAAPGSAAPARIANHGASATQPNVIIVLIDTLRADRVGFMGCPRPTSPVMDRWAAEGVVFERAIAPAPWTVPSIASIFTAMNPSVHHVLDHESKYGTAGEKIQSEALPADVETLAEAFAASGYQTCGVVANPWMTREYGFAQGFDSYTAMAKRELAYVRGEEVIDAGTGWLSARDRSRPCFLYLHLMDVHAPYNASDEMRRPFVETLREAADPPRITPGEIRPGFVSTLIQKTERLDKAMTPRVDYWRALYEAGVADVDAKLARLQRALEREGLWHDALLVVTADHGEALYEQGGWSHGMSPFHHQLHVPLLLRCPARWPAARRIGTTVSLTGLKPTLLELAGASSSAFRQVESFAGLTAGPPADGSSASDAGFAFSEGVKYFDQLKTAYSGDLKIVHDTRREQAVWFDLTKDPLEQRRDTVAADDPRAGALHRKLHAVMADNEANAERVPKVTRPLTAAQKKKLAQLGYVDDDGPNIKWPPYGAFYIDPANPDPPLRRKSATQSAAPP